MSDDQCAALSAYVGRGGSLIVAGETALADDSGNPQSELGQSDILSVTINCPVRGPVKNTYIALNGDHALTRGFDGAHPIVGGTHLIGVDTATDANSPFLTIPDFPDLPMEEVYPREEPKGAAVVTREPDSGGRTVYSPWNIGGVFREVFATDHQQLIENAVRWALGPDEKVRINGKSVLGIAVRENEQGLAVLMHNLTNPMMLKGPTRETFPVGTHALSVTLPAGTVAR